MAEWKDIEGIKIALQKTVNETDNELHKKDYQISLNI